MDNALLSKMVRELILDNDQVELPGLGSFSAEIVPASFSDRGYTINPPYRRLSFSPASSGDTLLIDLYARSNGVEKETARVILVQYLAELKNRLKTEKTIVFPGLGRLRATKENHFFFVCNEDLNIFPDGIGLEPISLKTHTETQEEVADAISTLAGILEPIPIVEIPAKPTAEPVPAADAETEAETEVPAGNEAPEESPAEPEAPSEETAPEPEPEVTGVPAAAAETETETEVPTGNEAPEETPAESEPEPKGTAGIVSPAEPHESDIQAVYYKRWEGDEPKLKHNYQRRRHRRRWWIAPLVLLAIAAVALAVFVVLAHVAPDFIDSILYTPEELRIINY